MRHLKMKSVIALLLVVCLLGVTGLAGAAEGMIEKPATLESHESPSGSTMMLDVLLIRPVSFVGLILGSATWLVAAPFALMADGTAGIEKISKPLVVEPAKYTFKRSVGEL